MSKNERAFTDGRSSRGTLPTAPLWSVLLIVTVVAGQVWFTRTTRARSGLRRHSLSSVNNHHGLTGRSVIDLPSGPCVLFHVVPSEPNQPFQSKVLTGVSSDSQDNGEVLTVDQACIGRSFVGAAYHESVFNCATFALGDAVGLKLNDWLDPNPNEGNYFTSPAQMVLDDYFILVDEYFCDKQLSWPTSTMTERIRDGEILCFTAVDGGSSEIAHFARAEKTAVGIRFVSKMGQGPIVRAPLQNYFAEFEGQVNCVRVYRRKSGREL